MGKIRVKTLGLEELEEQQKQKAKVKKEQKKARKTAKGAHGGERVVSMAPSEEEIERLSVVSSPLSETSQPVAQSTGQQKTDNRKKRARSKKYQTVAKLVDKNKTYALEQALELLPRLKLSNFDETVELHINTSENGISGNLTLPHGTGKKTKVAIADDKLIAEVEKGKIDFDVLLATPDTMPKLAKVAKFLGPRGLMPSPKNGTITQNPQELIKKYERGQINFRTESKAPIIHLSVGKLSTGSEKLAENIKAVLLAIQAAKIKKAVLKSTMSPGIKLDISSIS